MFIVTHFLSYPSAQGGGLGPSGFSCFYKRQMPPCHSHGLANRLSCWYLSGGKESTASVLRQDAEIAGRVQQDVNVLIKVTVFCEFEG